MSNNSLTSHEAKLDTQFFSKLSILSIGLLMIISVTLSFPFTYIGGFSFFMGGLIHYLPILVFGKLFFKKKNSLNAQTTVRTFYSGEALKLILTFLCFYIGFHWRLTQPAFLFSGYVVSLVVYWTLLFSLIKKASLSRN